MKLCVIVISLCLFSAMSFGQDAISDSSQIPTSGPTSLNITTDKIDSLQGLFLHSTDSLKNQYQKKSTRIDSAEHRVRSAIDSIQSIRLSLQNSLSANRIDSMQSNWKSRIDSLTSINASFSKLSNRLDSVQKLQEKTFSELNTKIQALKDKTVGKINSLDLPPQLSEKVSEATSRINQFQMPTAELNIPDLNAGGGLNVGGLENLKLPAGGDLQLDQIGQLENINEELASVSKISGTVGEYGDLKGLAKGDMSSFKDLPAAAEGKVEALSGLSEIKDQTKVLDEYKAMTGKIQNPDSLKEFALAQAKEIAIDHFSGKEEQLKQAMETLAKYKSKYPNVNSMSDITKRPPNEMKGKPLIERIVPGMGIQLQKKDANLLLDFNPYAAYRFTGRISAGIGWNQRMAINVDAKVFHRNAGIYGPRAFGEFKLGRGFSPRAEIEVMNTNVSPLIPTIHTSDPLNRQWIWGAFAGIKKEYKFIKNVKGTASVMMRLYNPDHKSPYADVINARFGFEFPMKKKQVTGK
jgi:hypothetical protein